MHKYPSPDTIIAAAPTKPVLVPIHVKFKTPPKPEAFACVFYTDPELPQTYAKMVAAQIRVQLEDVSDVAAVEMEDLDVFWPPPPLGEATDRGREGRRIDGRGRGAGLSCYPQLPGFLQNNERLGCGSRRCLRLALFGQGESACLVKLSLELMTRSELHLVMMSGFLTTSGSVLNMYISMGVPMQTLATSSAVSMPVATTISKLCMPKVDEPTMHR
ncbi:hypothetical protein CONPUDRAFT_159445 [Coniophora puteana RWD-64-598 SS2]|uniref:Uncharacterized protein n=1 Tax=Coniophora puteana (strain RWD-64-598) TaxID=741705 RepID=A0A5M3M9I4_CONPW|nr:uncharacterized protein CONPUDRAFT_159445 [Coniophora puteana RWD-64-598 SS2]EIW75321.1 hypothetical protein CONPUDRAFT_159445 [Coniophora puteana RWD-64-598 SS2]